MELMISALIGLLVYEIYAWLPAASQWLIERAVCRLPREHQDRFREEWLANDRTFPSSLARIVHALSFFVCGTTEKISREIFESRFEEIGEKLSTLRAEYDLDTEKLQCVIAMRTEAPQADLRSEVTSMVATVRSIDAPTGTAVALNEAAETLAKFGNNLIAAIERARALTAIGLDKVSARTDEVGGLLNRLSGSHSQAVGVFQHRKVSSAEVEATLMLLERELAELQRLVDEPIVDDDWQARDAEHERLIAAIRQACIADRR